MNFEIFFDKDSISTIFGGNCHYYNPDFSVWMILIFACDGFVRLEEIVWGNPNFFRAGDAPARENKKSKKKTNPNPNPRRRRRRRHRHPTEARRRRPRGRRRRIHRPLLSPTLDPPPVRSHCQRGGEGRGGEREERSRGPVVAACARHLHRRPHAFPALRWICKGRKEEGSRGGGAGPRAATAAPMLPSAGAGCKGRVGSRGEGRGHVPRRPPSLPAPAAWMQVEGGEGRGRMPHVPSATAPCTRAAGRLRL